MVHLPDLATQRRQATQRPVGSLFQLLEVLHVSLQLADVCRVRLLQPPHFLRLAAFRAEVAHLQIAEILVLLPLRLRLERLHARAV